MKGTIHMTNPTVALRSGGHMPAPRHLLATAKGSVTRLSIIWVLATLGALVALWAPVYLGILDFFGGELSPRSEALEWSVVAVGVFGFASVFYVAWKDTRDPAWRAAHGLPQSASNTPE